MIWNMLSILKSRISPRLDVFIVSEGQEGQEQRGTAISFCDAEEITYLKDIEKLITKRIEVVNDHPFPLVDFDPYKPPKAPSAGNSRPRSLGGRRSLFPDRRNVRR